MSEKDTNSTWSMIKLGLTLAAYAVVSCTILALVNWGTSGKIKQNQIDKANRAMKAVFQEADSFTQIDVIPSTDKTITIDNEYIAVKDGAIIGGIAQVTGPTYDKGTVIVGMTKDGIITGVQFLALSDSPGFGLKANDPTFKLSSGKTFTQQFEGVNAENGVAIGENFDAITGATITSKGVGALITQGTSSLKKYFEGAE